MATATQNITPSNASIIANNELISSTMVAGLKNLSTTLSTGISKILIANSLKLTLYPDATIARVPEIYATHAASAKQSEYAVVALYAVATKHGWDGVTMRQQLESLGLHGAAIDELTRVYEDNHKDLVMRQLQLGHSFPHITDVQWRIVCDAKSSTADCSSGEPHFIINLGQQRSSSGERQTIVEFICNAEELHSLINRLKDIERHCRQVASI